MGVANTTSSHYPTLARLPFERPDRMPHEDGRCARPRGRPLVWRLPDGTATRVFDGPRPPAIGTSPRARRCRTRASKTYVSADTSPCSASGPCSVATSRRPTIALALNPGDHRATSGRAATRPAATLGRKQGKRPTPRRHRRHARPSLIDSPFWMPLAQMPGLAAQRRDTPLMMIGRLPDDADLDRVRVDLSPIAANLAVAHPDTNKTSPSLDTCSRPQRGVTSPSVYIPSPPPRPLIAPQSGESAAGTCGISIARDRDPAGARRHAVADRARMCSRASCWRR